MKKIMMIAVMAVAALTANAQYYVGGSLGFNTTTSTTEVAGVSKDNTSSNISINPEIGYNLDEDWAIGLKFGVAHYEDLNKFGIVGMANSWSVNPYVRYTFVKAGNFKVFVDGGLAYANYHFNGTGDAIKNPYNLSVGFNPGISFDLSKKVSLVAHIGDLSYNHSCVEVKNGGSKNTTNGFNLSLTNAISFGAYVNF